MNFSGFAIGSFIIGRMYAKWGGAMTAQMLSMVALTAAFLYLLIYLTYLKNLLPPTNKSKLIP